MGAGGSWQSQRKIGPKEAFSAELKTDSDLKWIVYLISCVGVVPASS